MFARLWLRPFQQRWLDHRSRRTAQTRWRRRLPLRLEALEERITPTTYNVTPTGAGLQSLAGAIAQVNKDTGADTIVLAPGQYNLTAQLSVLSPTLTALTIQGAGSSAGDTVVDASGNSRAFLIQSSLSASARTSFTFQDLTIQHGKATDNLSGQSGTEAEGGGIADNGGNVALSNVVLQSNQAVGGAGQNGVGGGIYMNDGSLTITNSIIRNNQATGNSGNNNVGGYAYGGGVYATEATINASTLSGNKASGGDALISGDGGDAHGGGLYVDEATISNSKLLNNTAAGGDSAKGNGSSAHGGGIEGGEVTFSTSTLSSNTSAGGGSNAGGSGGNAYGAGIAASEAIVNSCTLTSNTASGGVSRDGAGGNAFGGGVSATAATLRASTLSDNAVNGGGTLNGADGGYAHGGGVDAEETTLTSSTLSGNTALGGKASNGHGGDAHGGGVYASKATFLASTLSGSTATGGDGQNGGEGTGADLWSYDAAIHASTLSSNTATGGNGLNGGNAGRALGGGVEIGYLGTLVNSTIVGNRAIGGLGTPPSDTIPIAAGGGLRAFKDNGFVTFTNVTVAYNEAAANPAGSGSAVGGGVQADSGVGIHIQLANTLVALNKASTAPDFAALVEGGDHNLIGNADGSSNFSAAHGDRIGTTANPLNPGLASALAPNGGSTQTLALLPGSPAINAGDNNLLSVTGANDQRGDGYARMVDGALDIGAFEFGAMPPPPGGGGSGGNGGSSGGGSSGGGGPAAPPSLFQALISLYIDGFYLEVDTMLHQSTEAVQASIDFYVPYAGPFASFLELAGRLAALQALP